MSWTADLALASGLSLVLHLAWLLQPLAGCQTCTQAQPITAEGTEHGRL